MRVMGRLSEEIEGMADIFLPLYTKRQHIVIIDEIMFIP